MFGTAPGSKSIILIDPTLPAIPLLGRPPGNEFDMPVDLFVFFFFFFALRWSSRVSNFLNVLGDDERWTWTTLPKITPVVCRRRPSAWYGGLSDRARISRENWIFSDKEPRRSVTSRNCPSCSWIGDSSILGILSF